MEINLKARTGTINLKSDGSLFGRKPEGISIQQFTDVIPKLAATRQGLESFGLFEASTPNYTTYYPDVTPDDLKPKSEDFIFPIFRALSATTVWKGYKPIDFSKAGVLKASMNKLIGQTINADHETALGNAMGAVKSVAWQEAYTVDGINVPAGINAEFMIDGKANPRIARGINADPPYIHSNSVSVKFAWEPSHTLKSDEEFYSKLGTRDAKGDLYRLVVTDIISFSETSLVAHGADAWAQIIKDDKIINPGYAAGVYSFSAKDDKGNKVLHDLSINYKTDLTVDLNADTILYPFNNNQNREPMDEILELLEAEFGIDSGTLKQDGVKEALANFVSTKVTTAIDASDLATKLTAVTEEKNTLTQEVETLKAEKAKFEPEALSFQASLKAERDAAKNLYQKLKGEDAEETILSLLDTCEQKTLETLTKGYEKDLKLKFPDTCKKCGSHEVGPGTSLSVDPPNPGTKVINRQSVKANLIQKAKEAKQ